MPSLTNKELLEIIPDIESDRVEFKESLLGDSPTKIREAICAFANDLPRHDKPGFVFVGIRNNRTIADLTVTDELLRQLADMKTDGNILPPPTLAVEKRFLEGKEIVVVTVQPSDSPPVKFKGVVHIRIGPRRSIATEQDERILNEKRRFGNLPFDLQPVPPSSVSDLNLTQFENEYLPQAFAPEILADNERTLEERLTATKMIVSVNERVATVLGILVLGKSPQDNLPGAYVQFLRINGSELADEILDSEDIRGAVPDLLRRLDEKLIAHDRIAVDFTTDVLERRTELYPIPALQQIIRNAIMHRTYESTNAPVRVSWFNDRIEVLSPGGAYGTVTAANFGEPGLTDYRNPNLAEAMRTLGYVQRFGVGIPTARKLLTEAGHPTPEFEVNDTHVQATIRSAIKS